MFILPISSFVFDNILFIMPSKYCLKIKIKGLYYTYFTYLYNKIDFVFAYYIFVI